MRYFSPVPQKVVAAFSHVYWSGLPGDSTRLIHSFGPLRAMRTRISEARFERVHCCYCSSHHQALAVADMSALVAPDCGFIEDRDRPAKGGLRQAEMWPSPTIGQKLALLTLHGNPCNGAAVISAKTGALANLAAGLAIPFAGSDASLNEQAPQAADHTQLIWLTGCPQLH